MKYLATERSAMARKLFNKSWRQLDGFLRHAVNLAIAAERKSKNVTR
jgi:hypothetical protein